MSERNEAEFPSLNWLAGETSVGNSSTDAPMPVDPEDGDNNSVEMAPITLRVFDSGSDDCVEFIRRMTAAEVEAAGHVDKDVIARTTFDGQVYYFLAVAPNLSKGFYGMTTDPIQIDEWVNPEYLRKIFDVR